MNMAIINLKLKTASVFTSVKDRIRDFLSAQDMFPESR